MCKFSTLNVGIQLKYTMFDLPGTAITVMCLLLGLVSCIAFRSDMWQSCVEIKRLLSCILSTLPCLKRCITELPLWVGLTHVTQDCHIYISNEVWGDDV